MSTYKKYLKGIHAKFGHFAAWLPDQRLALGDVGELIDQRFFIKTTLARLNIPFAIREGGEGGDDWSHTSGSNVSVDFSGEAKVAGASGLGGAATVKLGSAGAFLFQPSGCRTSFIEDMADVGGEISLAYRAERFESGWIVIDRLVTAKSATILISGSSSAVVNLSANAPLATMQALADASLGVKLERYSGEITQYVARAQLTPMYGASRLSRGFWGLGVPRVKTYKGDGDADTHAADGPLEELPAMEWLGDEEDANR